MSIKTCSRCDRPRENARYCRPCGNAYQKAYRKRTAWARFGLTEEGFRRAWNAQNGRCALCPKALHLDSPRGCHADHCHKTMRFRGLLCGNCNTALGSLGDTPEALARALAYVSIFS